MTYSSHVVEIVSSSVFDKWFAGLRDRQAKARIEARLTRLRAGNLGAVAPVGGGVNELKIDVGPGYRVYFVTRGLVLIVLLAGGDKSTQEADIVTAKAIAKQ